MVLIHTGFTEIHPHVLYKEEKYTECMMKWKKMKQKKRKKKNNNHNPLNYMMHLCCLFDLMHLCSLEDILDTVLYIFSSTLC